MSSPLLHRLRGWKDVVSVAPVAEDPAVLGGRQAEHFLHAPGRVAAVQEAVVRLGTWDTQRYYGDRVEIGDLVHLSVGGRVVPRGQFAGRGAVLVRWTRHRAAGLFKAVTGFGRLGRIDLPDVGPWELSPRDPVYFHRPGEPAPVQVPLLLLDGITLG